MGWFQYTNINFSYTRLWIKKTFLNLNVTTVKVLEVLEVFLKEIIKIQPEVTFSITKLVSITIYFEKKNQFWHYAFLVALLQIWFPIREFEEKPFCKQVPFCACDCAPLTTASPFCSIWEALCRWQLIEILLHFPLGRHTLLIPMLRAHYCCCCCCCWEVAREPAG